MTSRDAELAPACSFEAMASPRSPILGWAANASSQSSSDRWSKDRSAASRSPSTVRYGLLDTIASTHLLAPQAVRKNRSAESGRSEERRVGKGSGGRRQGHDEERE